MDFLFYPFFWLPDFISLSLVSLLAGLVLIGIYKFTSDQWAIAYWKEKLKTNQLLLLEGETSASVLKKLLVANFQMFRSALIPAFCCILFVLSILPWVGSRFGYQPLLVNESYEVEVKASKPWKLETTSNLRVSKNNMEFGSGRHSFEIMAEAGGRPGLTFNFLEDTGLSIFLHAGRNDSRRLWPISTKSRWYHLLVIPGYKVIEADNPVEEIKINYPSTASFFGFLGIDGWLGWFFILAFASGLWAKFYWGIE
ncbi:MAG: hypothetical protein ACQEP7_05955 [bacterium]